MRKWQEKKKAVDVRDVWWGWTVPELIGRSNLSLAKPFKPIVAFIVGF
jgi:hypothetical protein